VSAAGVSACTIGGSSAPPAPRATADDQVRAAVITDVSALVASYRAAITALPDLVATVGSLLAEHEAHLTALGPYPSTVPSPAPGGPSATSPGPTRSATGSAPAAPVAATSAAAAPSRPSALTLALDKLRTLELQAAPRTAAQAATASPQLARLVASIAGCERAHAAVLRVRR
jgi:hypothetical protein